MKRIRQKSLLMITISFLIISSILIITQTPVHGFFFLNPDNEPKITNVLATDISETSAIITWDTDKNSDSTVNYGPSIDLGDTESDSSLVKEHSILLDGLSPATTYFFEVQSGTPSGAFTIDNNTGNFHTFETLESNPPVISDVNIIEISEISAIISWDTDKNSDSAVNYGLSMDLDSTVYDPELVMQHFVTLSELEPGKTYNFEVRSTDSTGNTATDGVYEFTTDTPETTTPETTTPETTTPETTTPETTTPETTTPETTTSGDTIPPEISVVQAKKLSETTEKITWNTNEYSTSTVYFGTSTALGDSESNSTLTKRHTVELTDLLPDKTYYFKVESNDAAGNSAIDDNDGDFYTFITLPASETTTISPETTTTTTTTTSPSGDSPTMLLFVSNDQSTMNATIEIDETISTEIIYVPTGNPSDPIDGAMIRFIDNTDKVYMGWNELKNGIYGIVLTPKMLGDFTITIEATKDGFESNRAVLYLNVNPIETDLYFVSTYQANEIAPFRVNETYTTFFQFNRTSTTPETPIDDVNFTHNLVPFESEIVYTLTPLGGGKYQFEVTGNLNQSNQITFSIEASKSWNGIENGYESDYVTLVLFSGTMETELRFLSNNQTIETGTVQVYDVMTTSVQYYATGISPAVPIPEGSLNILSPDPDISYTQISNENGTYFLEISPYATGQFTLDLKASARPNYLDASASLTLLVEPISTNLRLITTETTNNHVRFIYLEPLEIIVRYSDKNEQGIEINNDNIDYKADGLEFLPVQNGETVGDYRFTFEASSPGIYQISLTFNKPNYASQEIQIIVEVDPIPMVNKQEQDIIEVETEQETKTVSIDLRNEADDSPIIGANVTYSFVDHPEINGIMEDLGNGTYVVDIPRENFVVDISREKMENRYIEIIAEKTNHATLAVKYNIIVKEPESFLIKYWKYFGILSSLVVGSTSSYALRKRRKRRARTLLEARKIVVLEYLADVAHFMDLLVITPSGIPFYSFTESISPKGLDPSLYSSFLLSIKTFADESLQNGKIANEDHFRFGGTEIFLYSIRELIFAFFFSAQLEEVDEWKKVSHRVLQRCRELTIQIENDFQDVLREFETYNRARIIPKEKLLEVVTKGLALDYVLPHYIIDMKRHRKVDIIDETLIIQTIEHLGSDEGVVSILKILEQLKSSEISTGDLLFTYYQLHQEGAIVPLDLEESLSVLEESLQESTTPVIDLDESLAILEESLQDSATSPNKFEENVSIFETSLQDLAVLPIVANNPEKILTLLEKLRAILTNQPEDGNSDL